MVINDYYQYINSNTNKENIAIIITIRKKEKIKNTTRVRSIQPRKCRDKFRATPKRPKPHSLKNKKYVLPVINTFVVSDILLSYLKSVSMSDTVVLNKLTQVLSNNDMTMIIAWLLLTYNH